MPLDVQLQGVGYHRRYSPDDTILLIGFAGAGKKTLGIIASVALRRRFVDFDAFFREEVHSSPQEYIAAHGFAQYRKVEEELSRDLLSKCAKGCVIVGLGGVANQRQQVLLTEFAHSHPVLYVRRDEADLRQFVTVSREKFERFYQAGNAFFEACSNFDFFNRTYGETQSGGSVPSSLRLKEAERVFMRFLHHVLGIGHHLLYSAEAFSSLHTLSLQVSLPLLDACEDFEVLEAGADAIAVIIDLDAHDVNSPMDRMARHMTTLREYSRVPIILDVNAYSQTDISIYQEVLEKLLRLAPDALTCSLASGAEFIRRLNASKGHTKIIATHHQPAPLGYRDMSPKASTLLEQVQSPGFDSLRITGESKSVDDNLASVAFQQKLIRSTTLPVIAYNSGPFGRASVCLNPTLSPVTLPGLKSSGITVQEAQKALASLFLTPPKTFTIFGRTLAHSLSPAMHNAAYTTCGLPHKYDIFHAESLSQIHQLLTDECHGGVAVSLPYKTSILPFLDEISPDAKNINAVNTIVLEQHTQADGSAVITRKGYNTDYIGIKSCIHKHLSPANAIRDGTTALIIGAGGMAHAAIYACYDLGIRNICIYNRTAENAQYLADYYQQWAHSEFGISFDLHVLDSCKDPWPVHLRPPTVVVSCLPGQQIGSASPVDVRISEQWLQSKTGGVFVEVAYGPSRTPLTEQIVQLGLKGWVMVDGLTLLVEQGIAQYELFTKRPAPVHVMRRVIQEQSARLGYAHT